MWQTILPTELRQWLMRWHTYLPRSQRKWEHPLCLAPRVRWKNWSKKGESGGRRRCVFIHATATCPSAALCMHCTATPLCYQPSSLSNMPPHSSKSFFAHLLINSLPLWIKLDKDTKMALIDLCHFKPEAYSTEVEKKLIRIATKGSM